MKTTIKDGSRAVKYNSKAIASERGKMWKRGSKFHLFQILSLARFPTRFLTSFLLRAFLRFFTFDTFDTLPSRFSISLSVSLSLICIPLSLSAV